jgi:hypothetical protein
MNTLDHIPERMGSGSQAIEHVTSNLEAQGGSPGSANATAQSHRFNVEIDGVATGPQQTIAIKKLADSATPNLRSFSFGVENPT